MYKCNIDHTWLVRGGQGEQNTHDMCSVVHQTIQARSMFSHTAQSAWCKCINANIDHTWLVRGGQGEQNTHDMCAVVHQTIQGRSMFRHMAQPAWDMCLEISDIDVFTCFSWHSSSRYAFLHILYYNMCKAKVYIAYIVISSRVFFSRLKKPHVASQCTALILKLGADANKHITYDSTIHMIAQYIW